MGRHESSVNFQNLIRDLADMYPREVDEVVIVELVANSLDAGANRISIDYDPAGKTLIISDDGPGDGCDAVRPVPRLCGRSQDTRNWDRLRRCRREG